MKPNIELESKSNIPSIFPWLYNIKDFIVREHPIYHPETVKYMQYWREHEKKCIEGLWGEDREGELGGWRYCPGTLYYYINFCVIEDDLEESNRTDIMHPLLRDVEWVFFYNWLICRGFSGFQDDPEYTSNLLVKKMEDGVELDPKDIIRLKYASHIKKEDGTYKKYIDAREYLYATHDKPLGRPIYGNIAKNMIALTSRRLGKSFWLMAIISHNFKFHGVVYYDDSYFSLKKGPEIVVGSVKNKSADMLKKFAFVEEYHKTNFGAWGENEDFIPGYFYSMTSGSLITTNQKSPYRNEYEYTEGKVKKKGGKGTKILHVTYEDNPEASVGTGPIVSIVEEVGLVDNILQVHSANETTLIRKNKFGSALYVGTAGNLEKILSTKILFEDPESYDMISFPDLWENRSRPIGLFIPAYYTDNSFRDKNGNQNLEDAYADIMKVRAVKAKAEDNYALAGWVMARPVKPSEMFLSGASNRFPIIQLRDQYTKVTTQNLFQKFSSKGILKREKDNKVKFIPDLNNTLRPIGDTNIEKIKTGLKGCCVFYEHPEAYTPNPNNRVSLYKVTYDPYRDDVSGTSFASILVHKTVSEDNWALGLSDDIVFEFLGRRDLVDEIHDICIDVALYYNAKILFESNIAGFLTHCRKEGFLHLLQKTPYEIISKSVINPGKKYGVGIDMTSPALHEAAEQMLNQWLLTPWKTDDDGTEYLNLNKLKSPRMLLELMQFDPANRNKSDHTAALKILMLWLNQEKLIPVSSSLDNIKTETSMFIKESLKRKQYTNNPYYTF